MLRPDSAWVIWPNGLVIATAALSPGCPPAVLGQHLLGHGLMFAAAAEAGGDRLRSGEGLAGFTRDRPEVIAAGRPLSACGRVGDQHLPRGWDYFRACGSAQW
jgi:hypothetical protein